MIQMMRKGRALARFKRFIGSIIYLKSLLSEDVERWNGASPLTRSAVAATPIKS